MTHTYTQRERDHTQHTVHVNIYTHTVRTYTHREYTHTYIHIHTVNTYTHNKHIHTQYTLTYIVHDTHIYIEITHT